MIHVTNCRHYSEITPEPDDTVIFVDRTNRILGNPFPMQTKTPVERKRVIALYKQKFDADFAIKGPMYQECLRIAILIEQGKSIALQCWCAPLPCHGDTIKRGIELILAERKTGGDDGSN